MVAIEDVIVEPPAGDEVVDPQSWFASPGPFEVEIGCGKGGFLLARARAHPQVRLLGIEWANKFFRYAADRMARWGVSNVRIMRTDAKPFVIRNLPAGCVSVLHLYHPDPWPKRRHHKRRLVDAMFVDAVLRILTPNGQWRIQSDHREYFEAVQGLVTSSAGLREVAWPTVEGELPGEWRGTNYEIKYTREGRPIWRMAFARDHGEEPALEIRSGANRTDTRAE